MIIGIGTDIIEINRVEKVINRTENFLNRNFSVEEVKYFKSRNLKVETIAGAFSAKEAVSKAMGTGFRGFSLSDIEILRNDIGKPFVKVSSKVDSIIKEMGIINYIFHLSISHSKENAIAYVILDGDAIKGV
ncbi:holo-ACP synthase [uncultured Clostridium sp.]|jgi:holo-[acyl-carrier protein] synthase|uniref:holo-ACP synthase n=1 Tax=uncultured Clostridium sp. TaxID=59620 RepID=UPI0026288F91|nr:holo-ACP synthase [uncultured Clostridium sp.]